MGISLNGLTPANTYPGLIKTGDNTAISGTPKVLSDGNGNNLPMEVSTTGVNFTNQLQQGGVAVPTQANLAAKQDTLVSGTNIKTVNSTTILGSGNLAVQDVLVSGTNIKTINGTSLLGSGNIPVVTSPSGVAGAIQFSNGSAFASDATNFFWDDTNERLGVGTNSPESPLSIVNTIALAAGATNRSIGNIAYTINNSGAQTGTATGIFLNATETALNGMTNRLMDLQNGGVSMLRVERLGQLSSIGYSIDAARFRFNNQNFNTNFGYIQGNSNGVFSLIDNTEVNFNRLQFGGTTSSFPSIKRNGTGIDFRLADDSGFCPVNTGVLSIQNTVASAVAVASTHKVTVVISGTTYYLLASNV